MNYIAQKISLFFYIKGNICFLEIDDIRYGIEVILAQIVTFIPMLVVGLLFGKVQTTITFLLVFISLRVNSDGYHCKIFTHCFFVTNVIYWLCVFLIPNYLYHDIALPLLIIGLLFNIIRWHYELKLESKKTKYLILLFLYFSLAIFFMEYISIEIMSILIISSLVNFKFKRSV